MLYIGDPERDMGPKMRYNIVKGYVFVIISAIIFGCMPLGAKIIYADGVNALTLVFLRNALSLPALALLAKKSSRTLRLPNSCLWEISVIAFFGCCITPILLFSSYNYISSGTATVFHFIYPAVTVLGGILFFRERVRFGPMVCILVCTLGVSLFYEPGVPIHLWGSVLALCSGMTYAIYIMLLSRFHHKEVSGFKFSFYTAAVCSLFILAMCLLTCQFRLPHSPAAWLTSMIFSLVLSVGAVVLFQQGTFLIGGQRAAILSTFEPITSLLVGFLAFQENISFRLLIGSTLVIAATVIIAVVDMLELKKKGAHMENCARNKTG